MWGYFAVLPIFAVLLCVISFVLQLITIPSTYWGHFTAREDVGKPAEHGHYGLWSICSTKAPHWIDDCDPMDTFFQLPTYALASGGVAIIHMVVILIFLPLAMIRVLQVVRGVPDLCVRPKFVCLGKVSIAFIAVIFNILICVLASVGESRFREYDVQKGHAFWIQITILIVDLLLALICAFENIQFWQLEALDSAARNTGEDDISETYGNPNFDENIYVTPSSGRPLPDSNGHIPMDDDDDINEVRIKEGGTTVITIGGSNNTFSYENPAFREQSPRSRRKRLQSQYRT